MQGMDKKIPELFAMVKAVEVEIKKEHQVLMVNKTTSFKKKGKGNYLPFMLCHHLLKQALEPESTAVMTYALCVANVGCIMTGSFLP